MNKAPTEKTIVIVRGKEVILDPDNLQFNELTLSNYLDREYGWIDYFGKQLEFANKDVLDATINYDAEFSKVYIAVKDQGNPENYSKMKAMADTNVIQLRKELAEKKEIASLIKAHLNAWKQNHDNARGRGFQINAELKVLGEKTISDTVDADEFLENQK